MNGTEAVKIIAPWFANAVSPAVAMYEDIIDDLEKRLQGGSPQQQQAKSFAEEFVRNLSDFIGRLNDAVGVIKEDVVTKEFDESKAVIDFFVSEQKEVEKLYCHNREKPEQKLVYVKESRDDALKRVAHISSLVARLEKVLDRYHKLIGVTVPEGYLDKIMKKS